MSAAVSEVTSISTKGQVVLPKAIRDSLSLVPGSKLMVLTDGDNILMKPIKEPSLEEFDSLMVQSRELAKKAGMTEDDITEAIKSVRKRRKTS